jgi:hypothetical protein
VAIIGLVLSAFAGGGGTSASGGAPASAPGAPTPAGGSVPVDASAQKSCADFDLATARLAAKDNSGFINDMSDAATAAQDAATRDPQWQVLVGNYAAFATDLAANDATSVFTDLNAVNQECSAVRGQRPLVLNNGPAPPTAGPAPTTGPVPTTRPAQS